MSRNVLLDYVRQRRQAGPFRVVDIGGAYKPWTAEVADAFVDLFPVDGAPVIQGDINERAVWDEIKTQNFDFCICSHTLEDVRDPIFVLGQMRAIFQHGYIATPSKHVEFSNIESPHYVGFGHHRWIFTLAGDEIRFIAKFPLASYFSSRRRLARLTRTRFFRRLKRLWERPGRTSLNDVAFLPWWRKDLAGSGNELAFIWSGDLRYRVINGDYAGRSTVELGMLYSTNLAEGL